MLTKPELVALVKRYADAVEEDEDSIPCRKAEDAVLLALKGTYQVVLYKGFGYAVAEDGGLMVYEIVDGGK